MKIKSKLTYIFITILIFHTYFVIAHNKETLQLDSLREKLFIAKDDTNKVNLYNKIFYEYTFEKAEDANDFIKGALELSTKLDFKNEEIKTNIGRMYWKLGKMDLAIQYHFDVLKKYERNNDINAIAYISTLIGQDYADGGNFNDAQKYFLKAKNLYIKSNNKERLSRIYLLISWVYGKQGNFPESSKNNLAALQIAERLKDDHVVAIAASNLVEDLFKLDKTIEAIPYILKSIKVLKKIPDYINLSGNYLSLAKAYSNLHNNSKAINFALLSFETAKKANDKASIGYAQSKLAELYLVENNIPKAVMFYKSAINYFREVNSYYLLAENYSRLSTCYVRMNDPVHAKSAIDSSYFFGKKLNSRLLFSVYLNSKQVYDSLTGNWKEAYFNHFKYIAIRDSLFNVDYTRKVLQTQMQYEFDKKEELTKAKNEAELKKQKIIRNGLVVGFIIVLLFAMVFLFQRNKISEARKRSEELLLNILPEVVAEELKAKGSAEAQHIDEVTVLFTDFKGFTQLSEKLSPKELVAEINECFSAFDHIVEKYGVEKIKTIGDAYMAAGGLPTANRTHAEDVVKAALAIQAFMQEHKTKKMAAKELFFEIRIGIHTGPVVAGIVGVKKFAYDIWGDTVNTASRMESSGEVGKVNISGTTYELVKDKFTCVHRGKVQAKGKGEIDMYFIS